MKVFNGTIEGRNGLLDFLEDRPEAVDPEIREALKVASREVPVAACAIAARIIYARREECPPSLLDVGAGLAATLGAEGFYGFGDDALGLRMAAALRRDAGVLPEGIAPQAPEDDPDPDPFYVRKAEEKAPAPPPSSAELDPLQAAKA
jgi:hypothetical protein